jgi:integrase
MPRKRLKQNKGLPSRWQFTHGAYYFRVPPGLEAQWDGKKRFRLGTTLAEAHRTFAERAEIDPATATTMGHLLDRYVVEELPRKAAKTRHDQVAQIRRLRAVFGNMLITSIDATHAYDYAERRGAATAAKREIEILSHAFTKAIKWKYIKLHPLKGQVQLDGSGRRERYVEDWEVIEALSLESKRKLGSILALQAYIRIKLLTGMSRGDLLRLEPAKHFKADGIHIQRHKTRKSTGKKTVYEWNDDLKQAVQVALDARPAKSFFLFCNRAGEGYVNEAKGTAKGWDKIWSGFMRRLLTETKVSERFTEHDLRAKVACDAPTLEHARGLLSHADARMTARYRDRKPERVATLSNSNKW